jgi:hypothetical protein
VHCIHELSYPDEPDGAAGGAHGLADGGGDQAHRTLFPAVPSPRQAPVHKVTHLSFSHQPPTKTAIHLIEGREQDEDLFLKKLP